MRGSRSRGELIDDRAERQLTNWDASSSWKAWEKSPWSVTSILKPPVCRAWISLDSPLSAWIPACRMPCSFTRDDFPNS